MGHFGRSDWWWGDVLSGVSTSGDTMNTEANAGSDQNTTARKQEQRQEVLDEEDSDGGECRKSERSRAAVK